MTTHDDSGRDAKEHLMDSGTERSCQARIMQHLQGPKIVPANLSLSFPSLRLRSGCIQRESRVVVSLYMYVHRECSRMVVLVE